MKKCSKCKEEKLLTEYGIDNSNKSGYRYQCKVCRNKGRREFAKENPENIKARNLKTKNSRQAYYKSEVGIKSSRRAHLKRVYNITLEAYESKLEEQGGVCKICKKDEKYYRNKVLSVDHCHTTKVIRGLLCCHCNMGIGHFMDNPKLLYEAIKYLKNYERN